ncbi:hypothetical protein A2U01_0062025, partial [Trifolium medium]|nr:hypothetical protein [Trifolium medium]
KKDTRDTLRGDAPLGGVHQEGTLHLLDIIGDSLRSRKNATKGPFRGESWIFNCPQDWKSHPQLTSMTVRPTLSTT